MSSTSDPAAAAQESTRGPKKPWADYTTKELEAACQVYNLPRSRFEMIGALMRRDKELHDHTSTTTSQYNQQNDPIGILELEDIDKEVKAAEKDGQILLMAAMEKGGEFWAAWFAHSKGERMRKDRKDWRMMKHQARMASYEADNDQPSKSQLPVMASPEETEGRMSSSAIKAAMKLYTESAAAGLKKLAALAFEHATDFLNPPFSSKTPDMQLFQLSPLLKARSTSLETPDPLEALEASLLPSSSLPLPDTLPSVSSNKHITEHSDAELPISKRQKTDNDHKDRLAELRLLATNPSSPDSFSNYPYLFLSAKEFGAPKMSKVAAIKKALNYHHPRSVELDDTGYYVRWMANKDGVVLMRDCNRYWLQRKLKFSEEKAGQEWLRTKMMSCTKEKKMFEMFDRAVCMIIERLLLSEGGRRDRSPILRRLQFARWNMGVRTAEMQTCSL